MTRHILYFCSSWKVLRCTFIAWPGQLLSLKLPAQSMNSPAEERRWRVDEGAENVAGSSHVTQPSMFLRVPPLLTMFPRTVLM